MNYLWGQTSTLYFEKNSQSLGYDQSSYDYFPKKDRIYYPDLSDIRRRRLAEIGHEKKNNKAVFKGGLILEDILRVKVLGILKTWMDYCEHPARSCEHLNFPAHLS